MEKVFIGSTKAIDTQYGVMIKVGMKAEDLATLEQHLDERGYVNIVSKQGKSGKWYSEIDTYKPKQEAQVEQGNYDNSPIAGEDSGMF